MNLLDLMAPPRPPIWRDGKAHYSYMKAAQGDLQWIAKDYRDHRMGGRWYRYNDSERIWRCLDPYDQYGINTVTDLPPAVNEYGRLL